uniref:Similar to Os07g0681600 n=1 Tax=Arundo donax TaxID=35708 RepID=A0A0A9CWS7_ARUDO
MRPSTGARLVNIDGVNQHFISCFSGIFIQNITQLSKELNLALDNSSAVENRAAVPKPAQTNNLPGNLGGAKLTAWELWHKHEFSFLKIAYFRRAVPIKEQTVISYLLDAARDGYEMDWSRFCREIGLTPEIASGIHLAIEKVGSRDKLKPIKEELPENVSYDMIKTFLTIEGRGLSEQIFGNVPTDGAPRTADSPISVCHASEAGGNGNLGDCVLVADACDISPSAKRGQIDGMVISGDKPATKLQKIQEHVAESTDTTCATEESILELIGSRDGVSLEDVAKHFKGSKRESVVEILNGLESDFSIYKKNGLYMML